LFKFLYYPLPKFFFGHDLYALIIIKKVHPPTPIAPVVAVGMRDYGIFKATTTRAYRVFTIVIRMNGES
jgi:hypothetical protein